MLVKAKEGMSFKVLTQRVNDKEYISVTKTHDVLQKVKQGFLIEKPKNKPETKKTGVKNDY